MMAGMVLAGTAQAQQQALPPSPQQTAAEAQDAFTAPAQAEGNVTTLGEVRALKPEDDAPLDLYRFKNPVQPAPNRFSKSWSEPPSPEQVSMSGGYIFLGLGYVLKGAGKGLHKLTRAPVTRAPDQIQSAIARPPPELTEQQQRRAAAYCEAGDCAAEER
ncbi:hypothetical protein [Stenotrophomonas sp.]|uniref:hypothetical protein n=1 Tax=Stenotrophomonas sp. TaxID=69392 RepID=UPI003D6CBCA6